MLERICCEIRISFYFIITGTSQSAVYTFPVVLQKADENATFVNAENITFDNSIANMLSFNVSVEPEKTASLIIVPLSDITSYKMLIKTDSKPTLNEIVEDGFLYPEELVNTTFTDLKLLKRPFVPRNSYQERAIYLRPNNSLWGQNFSGMYYIGLTLDIDHNITMQIIQSYSDCLWNDDKPNCKEIVYVKVDIQTLQLGCFYWDETSDKWANEGCEVRKNSLGQVCELSQAEPYLM